MVSRVACLKEGLDESYGRRGRDVESERGEDKRSCEATSTDLMRGNFDETGDFLESKHDMTLVREVAIVLCDFAFLGVETRRGKVEREKTAVWDLGKVVLGVEVVGADCSGSCRLVSLVLFSGSGKGRFGTEGGGGPSELVCTVGGLGRLRGRGRSRPGEKRGHLGEGDEGKREKELVENRGD